MIMKPIIALLLCVAIPHVTFAASGNAYNVQYDGGSQSDLKTGSDLKLFIDEKQVRLVRDKKDVLVIPATAITELSYGQDVHRRIGAAIGVGLVTFGIGALLALAKSKKHFIGITWDDGGKKGGLALQADKSNYRGLLAGLEGITGKKAVNADTLTVKN